MASIFNSLNIGYSGLNAAQIGIDTTGHNISNAETDGYTRERVVTSATTPIFSADGNVGNGVEIQTVKRVFDNYVFDRYTSTYAEKEYTDLSKEKLEELSTYFPEVDEVGIKADLQKYYDMWQTLADNPDNDSIKLALAKQTEILAEHIGYTQSQVKAEQSQLNNQIETNINEINEIAKNLADLNISIDTAESGTLYSANDLRDKRNVYERDLARLIGADTNSGQLQSNIQIDTSSNTKTGSYTVSINGFNLVDGSTYHPINVTNTENKNGFYELSYEREDGVFIPLEENITDGKIGALLDLRGGTIDSTSGMPVDGVLQKTITELDAFARGIIETTNNLYARDATTRMDSNPQQTNPDMALLSSSLNINEGSFSLVVYDTDGNKVSSRDITIDSATTMSGVAGSNSIEAKINANHDDNEDQNANNDIDDFINFNYASLLNGEHVLELSLSPISESRGYRFAIEDNLKDETFSSGTNFAGALGLGRYLDGNDASSMDLNFQLKDNPTKISAGYTDVSGDSRIALDMVQHQFESFDFVVDDDAYNTTTYGMFDMVATEVGIQTNSAIMRSETVNTQFNAVELEYFSISKVSIDEEMTNLIRYQTSYGAAAKVITTIDQMMQTLLGIKS
jgi:flagellar hook-associated protein 1 FlgK